MLFVIKYAGKIKKYPNLYQVHEKINQLLLEAKTGEDVSIIVRTEE